LIFRHILHSFSSGGLLYRVLFIKGNAKYMSPRGEVRSVQPHTSTTTHGRPMSLRLRGWSLLLLLMTATLPAVTVAEDDYDSTRTQVSDTSSDSFPWKQRRCHQACFDKVSRLLH
jgi:hypothetical protein